MASRFQVTSSCIECQAIADAQTLFARIEAIGRREGVGPDRMARALRELAAAWYSLLLSAHGPESGGPIGAELDAISAAFERSLRRETARAFGQASGSFNHAH